MKKHTLLLMAALVVTVIIGANTGNEEAPVHIPETVEMETELENV